MSAIPVVGERRLTPPRDVQATGCFCPFRLDAEQPVTLKLPDVAACFVPIFTTPEKLHEAMTLLRVSRYSVKVITDGKGFVAGIRESGARVMLDPRNEDGRSRWTEIVREGEEMPGADHDVPRTLGGAPC